MSRDVPVRRYPTRLKCYKAPNKSTSAERRVALVTGSSRGLGREIALRFARGGWNVVVNCVRSTDKANAVADEARSLGGDAIVVQADVSDLTTHPALINGAVGRWSRLDCLVNNAAIPSEARITNTPERLWDEVIATDLLGPMHLARRAAEVMRPGSSVVNITSLCGLWGCVGASAYSAAKGALAGFTAGAAAELAAKSVRINTVAPGYMPTDMGRAAPRAMDAAKAQHAMRVLSDPAATAEFILQLAQMRTVTGQVFNLDGRIR
ncbi:MAG: SDR family NAD(P)-dependent oxidoreductase [Planctomycetota bacterium]